METVAFAFIFTLLLGLVWLFVFNMVDGPQGYVMHDHNMDGIQDDATGGHFHTEDIAHNHQNPNLDGTLGRYPNNLSHPNHYFQ